MRLINQAPSFHTLASNTQILLCHHGHVLLLQVPLGITSTARVFVVNDGYDNLELTVRLPPDSSHLPVTVSFPEGKLIGLAKERLPLIISCSSSKPLSFTAPVELLDEDGRAFSLMVTGATDNSSLSHGAFMQLNSDRLQLLPPLLGGYAMPCRLADAQGYSMPFAEVVGPLHLTQVRWCADAPCLPLAFVPCKSKLCLVLLSVGRCCSVIVVAMIKLVSAFMLEDMPQRTQPCCGLCKS